jgi:hypothetical protein
MLCNFIDVYRDFGITNFLYVQDAFLHPEEGYNTFLQKLLNLCLIIWPNIPKGRNLQRDYILEFSL